MTTTITVKANHGWPVKVSATNPKTAEPIASYGAHVPAGETRDFICHSDMDLHIHEIQPGETSVQEEPAIALGDTINFSVANRGGQVVGKAVYLDENPSYYVRYVNADGDQRKEWFSRSDIKPVV